MSCDQDAKYTAEQLQAASQIARGGVDAADRCIRLWCNAPLTMDRETCSSRHPQCVDGAVRNTVEASWGWRAGEDVPGPDLESLLGGGQPTTQGILTSLFLARDTALALEDDDLAAQVEGELLAFEMQCLQRLLQSVEGSEFSPVTPNEVLLAQYALAKAQGRDASQGWIVLVQDVDDTKHNALVWAEHQALANRVGQEWIQAQGGEGQWVSAYRADGYFEFIFGEEVTGPLTSVLDVAIWRFGSVITDKDSVGGTPWMLAVRQELDELGITGPEQEQLIQRVRNSLWVERWTGDQTAFVREVGVCLIADGKKEEAKGLLGALDRILSWQPPLELAQADVPPAWLSVVEKTLADLGLGPEGRTALIQEALHLDETMPTTYDGPPDTAEEYIRRVAVCLVAQGEEGRASQITGPSAVSRREQWAREVISLGSAAFVWEKVGAAAYLVQLYARTVQRIQAKIEEKRARGTMMWGSFGTAHTDLQQAMSYLEAVDSAQAARLRQSLDIPVAYGWEGTLAQQGQIASWRLQRGSLNPLGQEAVGEAQIGGQTLQAWVRLVPDTGYQWAYQLSPDDQVVVAPTSHETLKEALGVAEEWFAKHAQVVGDRGK